MVAKNGKNFKQSNFIFEKVFHILDSAKQKWLTVGQSEKSNTGFKNRRKSRRIINMTVAYRSHRFLLYCSGSHERKTCYSSRTSRNPNMSSTTAESSIGWSFRFSASLKQSEQPPFLKGMCHEREQIFEQFQA